MPKDEVDRETIAAIATAPGRGGIGVVRLSGSKVVQIAATVAGGLPVPRHATLCVFKDRSGQRIDEGIALYFAAPHSYTGEDVLELQGHGGPVVMQMLLAACVPALVPCFNAASSASGRSRPSRLFAIRADCVGNSG